MNSILYLAETKIYEDFYSMLFFEFFCYNEQPNKVEFSSFYKYLEKKIEFNLHLLKEENKSINLDINSLSNDELDIIRNSVYEIKEIKKKTKSDYHIDINLNDKATKKNMSKLFLLHKNKSFFFVHSKYYNTLQQSLKEIATNNNYLSLNFKSSESKLNYNKKIMTKNLNISILDELEHFLDDTFKIIDPNRELEDFKISLQNIREGIIGRKIRIAFIGNISVGKSTVLNSIIGEDILPTNDKECTYRGIIIRHSPGDIFKLYKTKIETRGKGSDEYYYFVEDIKPYRIGIENIKSYLNVKNNDKIIEDKDAYLVIKGNLKIFDFIELDKDIISQIEFIDLPGLDREKNEFIEKQYHKKILKFSNCCVYINESKTIEDDKSVIQMEEQYKEDKEKIFHKFRSNFIKTCLFLINKSDTLENKDDKIKLEESIFKRISKVEKNLNKNDINISFFSGKYFLKYLNVVNDFIQLLENKPSELFLKLYKEYSMKSLNISKTFKTFILDKISIIEENFFSDDLEEDNKGKEKPPYNFKINIKSEIEKFEKEIIKYKLLDKPDYDDIIQKIYNVNKKLKKIDFSNTYYSSNFFNHLKQAIENSVQLNKENLKNSIINLFEKTDILFARELMKKTEEKKKQKQTELNRFQNFRIIIQKNFEKTRENIEKIFKEGKNRILEIIDEEIENSKEKLEESNKNLEIAANKLTRKINPIIEEMKSKHKEEINKLIKEIEKEIKQKFEEIEIQVSSVNIDPNKDNAFKFIPISIQTSSFLIKILSIYFSIGVEFIMVFFFYKRKKI